MMRTATKNFILIFAGLLWTAVFPTWSYAEGKTEKKPEKVNIVQVQSAKDFLSTHVEGDGWKEYVDAKKLVTCGTKKCNLDKKVCMKKTDDKGVSIWATIKDSFGGYTTERAFEATAGGAVMGSIIPGVGTVVGASVGTAVGTVWGAAETFAENGETRVKITKYQCIEKTEQESFQKQGYTVAAEGGKETKTSTNNKGTKTKTSDVRDEECYTATGNTGEGVSQYCLKMSGDQVIVVGYRKGTSIFGNSCEVIPVKLYYQQRCSFCFLMGGIYATADKITVQSYNKLGKGFAIVIVLGLALWIAIKTLSYVSSMTKQDAAKYITEMIKQSYKFAIAYFALFYYGDVFNYIINPLLEAGLTFGNAFVNFAPLPRPELFPEDAVVDKARSLADLVALGDKMPADYLLNSQNVYFTFENYAKLDHLAYNVNFALSILQVVGETLVCRGFGYLRDWSVWGLSWPCMIYGAIFWVFGFLLSFAFVFYLLDAIVQLGIVGALLPFLIASWPFKITAKWTSTGFKLLLNSIFRFMLMGLLSRVIVELVNEAVKANSATGDAGLDVLIQALDTGNPDKLKELVNVLSVGFCLFIFTNMIGFLLMGRVSELINKFADGGMKPVSPRAATIGASAVKGVASKVTRPIRKAAGDRFDRMAKATGRKLGGFIFGARRKGSASGTAGAGGPTVTRGSTGGNNGNGSGGRRPQSGQV